MSPKRFLRFVVLLLVTAGLCIVSPPTVASLSNRLPNPAASNSVIQAQNTLEQQVQAGRDRYVAEQYSQAAELWQQAAADYAAQGDTINQAMTLSNLGLAYLKLGDYPAARDAIATSLELLTSSPATDYSQRVQAQALSAQAQLQMAQGQPEVALDTLEQAAEHYQTIGDEAGVIRSQLNQAQILQVQGLYRNALALTATIQDSLQNQPNSSLKVSGLRQLGNLQRLVGSLADAQTSLQQSLQVAQAINAPADISASLLSLGNIADSTGSPDAAINYYQQAADTAPTPALRLQALINQFGLQVDQRHWPEAQALIAPIQAELPALAPSRTHIYLQINFAQSLLKALQDGQPLVSSDAIATILSTAINQAKTIEDARAESYGLGYLGQLYQLTGQLAEAAELTEQAYNLAQAINASSIVYQWQWQLGQILNAQGDTERAIQAYSQAIQTLQDLRSDLVAVNPEVRFSFREGVEPIYRELVGLLLKDDDQAELPQENLLQARNVIESLQVAELVNFFRADCVVTSAVQIDQIDTQAAVIYPIILPDRLEVVLSLPDQPLSHHTVQVSQTEVQQTLDDLRTTVAIGYVSPSQSIAAATPSTDATDSADPVDESEISDESSDEAGDETDDETDDEDITVAYNPQAAIARRISRSDRGLGIIGLDEIIDDETIGISASIREVDYLPLAKQVYSWLIEPLADRLAATETETLVFVLDGALRNVPMSVLYDEVAEQHLIEKYAIALTPGLQLFDPKPLAERRIQAIVGGLTESRQGFSALPAVAQEVETIESEVPSEILLNDAFQKEQLEDEVISLNFPVVHLATHGQFSSDLEETFILTWDDRINANELSSLLQTTELNQNEAIELLILSACETAAGDDRAALGLAGVAVRSGARSTLATLWQVNDAGTSKLMGEVYRRLGDANLTKAEVLQQAQLSLLQDDEYAHPFFWAPFVLLGNWL
ncbi:MAG: CHAT domain-containing protein [Thainema sp.]